MQPYSVGYAFLTRLLLYQYMNVNYTVKSTNKQGFLWKASVSRSLF